MAVKLKQGIFTRKCAICGRPVNGVTESQADVLFINHLLKHKSAKKVLEVLMKDGKKNK